MELFGPLLLSVPRADLPVSDCPWRLLNTLYFQKYSLTCRDSHINLSDVCPPFTAITASTLLGRLSTRFVCVYGIIWPFFLKCFCEATEWCWTGKPGSQSPSNSSQRCSIGLRWGLCAGQSSSSTPNSLIYVFIDVALCTGAQSCWNRKGPSPNCFHHVESMELSKISWYAEEFRVPFTGTKGPSPAPEKQPHNTIIPPPLNFTFGTIQSDKYLSAGNCQTQTRPSDYQMEKHDSSLQWSRLHRSIVKWRCALHRCIRRFALHLLMYGVDAAARPWKHIPWSSLSTVLELIWGPRGDWRSVVIDSTESLWPLRTMRLSIHWPRSIILRGLPLCGKVAVIPNRLHFVIVPLIVDCGIFRSEEISWLDLLHRWHPITVSCWNSLSSWERPILSQMFVETVCMPRCLHLYTCGHGSDWNTWFQLFG